MNNGITPTNWDQMAFEALMNAEAKNRHAGRAAFQPGAPLNKYQTVGVDNYVTSDKSNQLTLGQALTPITVRASVSIGTSAQDHLGLREFAARRMGDAFSNIEDAIVLLGKEAKVPSRFGPVTFEVNQGELIQQTGLFFREQGQAKSNVIASAIAALNQLRSRGHHGPFVVIVSTDLNQEAWTPTAPGIVNAPIYAILPELRSQADGWIWSDVLGSRQGVAISLGGESFDFIITYDPHVDSAITSSGFVIEAGLQFCLRINDSTAIEPLQ